MELVENHENNTRSLCASTFYVLNNFNSQSSLQNKPNKMFLKSLSILFFALNILCMLMFCYYLLFYTADTKEKVTFANEKILRYFVGFWGFLYLSCIAEILRQNIIRF